MKAKRKWLTAGAALVAVLLMAGSARADVQIGAKIQIQPRPADDLRVWIWPDRGEGADYLAGDDIAMYVEANRDCFLILYNVDTRGRLNILFPYDPWTDNFVRGGETVRFPRPREGQDWVVEGPPGTEYVQAIASTFPIAPPDWPVYIRSVNGRDAVCHDRELNDFWSYDDRLAYIDVVNRKITRRYWHWCATDLATFHVRPHHWWLRDQPADPWPDVFYGEIFIGWPAGGKIFVDNVFIGYAPILVPRHQWGRHVITCYFGDRLVRRHQIRVQPKDEYRYRRPAYGKVDVRARGYVKSGRAGRPEGFRPAPLPAPAKVRLQDVRSGSVGVSRTRDREDRVITPSREKVERTEKVRKTRNVADDSQGKTLARRATGIGCAVAQAISEKKVGKSERQPKVKAAKKDGAKRSSTAAKSSPATGKRKESPRQ